MGMTTFLLRVAIVIKTGAQEQVCRITTGRVVAFMKHLQAWWNRALHEDPRHAVRLLFSASQLEASVAEAAAVAGPWPARFKPGGSINAIGEVLGWFFSLCRAFACERTKPLLVFRLGCESIAALLALPRRAALALDLAFAGARTEAGSSDTEADAAVFAQFGSLGFSHSILQIESVRGIAAFHALRCPA